MKLFETVKDYITAKNSKFIVFHDKIVYFEFQRIDISEKKASVLDFINILKVEGNDSNIDYTKVKEAIYSMYKSDLNSAYKEYLKEYEKLAVDMNEEIDLRLDLIDNRINAHKKEIEELMQAKNNLINSKKLLNETNENVKLK